ncbi:uncharacterized protein PHALS_15440 [Plasmopara halstedii]|uniref:Uncharacterized protein n=1 Tax=Plasmopara halstedii TaxID=4781 RepID=A0A0P1AIL6_PLAHL|nr:uncharacterized protein PHALS_15440 [Plasmopara halstedii]CEG40385.1 hypothetical protein PHALS_15440 [Plasmopara halstedii]|eukprot:XP_024576754.1 hypothetical protein PHALS_15440 [Plasmopara halstedii]
MTSATIPYINSTSTFNSIDEVPFELAEIAILKLDITLHKAEQKLCLLMREPVKQILLHNVCLD